MSRLSFPTAAPTESVVAIPKMVLDGSWKDERRTFGEHCWTVQGFGMGLVLKNAAANELDNLRSNMNVVGVTDEQYDNMFNALCDVHNQLAPGSDARKAFSPLQLLTVLKLVMSLLEQFKS